MVRPQFLSNPILKWPQAGRSTYTKVPASQSTIMDIRPLSGGRLAFGAADPTLGLFDAADRLVWSRPMEILDLRWNTSKLHISSNGHTIQFGFDVLTKEGTWNRRPARFDLNKRRLILDPADTDRVSRVQRQLAILGYKPGPVDGILGSRTRAAIRAFQSDKQVPVDGRLSPALLQALGKPELRPPRTTAAGLRITGWKNTDAPKLNGRALRLDKYEMSRSLAIAPDGKHFLLGNEWSLRYFDHTGTQLWEAPVPGVAWAVNIAENAKVAVAAIGDGTLRWYDLSDGQLLGALFCHPDGKRWVAWLPEGFFDAANGGEALIGYHLNRGADQAGEFVGVSRLEKLYYRPDLVAKRLQGGYEDEIAAQLAGVGNIDQVIASGLPPRIIIHSPESMRLNQRDFEIFFSLEDQGGGVGRIEYRVNDVVVASTEIERSEDFFTRRRSGRIRKRLTGTHGKNRVSIVAYDKQGNIASEAVEITAHINDPLKDAPSLHVLAVGVTDYRDRALQLKYAHSDARDIAAELEQRGTGLFRRVSVTPLLNQEANSVAIEKAFADLSKTVKASDVFVLYLAGHGAALDGNYYFIPWDAVYENRETLKKASLSHEKILNLLEKIPALKSLIILDTCYSARLFAGLDSKTLLAGLRGMEEKTAIDRLMRATGRTFLAAATEQQPAIEGHKGHGVFTYVLLEGLRGSADRKGAGEGVISIDELADFVRAEVPQITIKKWGFEQIPMRHMRGDPFAIGCKQGFEGPRCRRKIR